MYTLSMENTKNPYRKACYKHVSGSELEANTRDGWRLIQVLEQPGCAPAYLLASTPGGADLARDLALALAELGDAEAEVKRADRERLDALALLDALEVPERLAAHELALLSSAAEHLAADAAGYFGAAETYTGAAADVPHWVRSRLLEFGATITGGVDAP